MMKTVQCKHNAHAGCVQTALCECVCHERELTRGLAREAAHQAVKNFDRKPDVTNTAAAIQALQKYLDLATYTPKEDKRNGN